MDKNKQVDNLIHKLKLIALNKLEKNNINASLAALSFASETLYAYNQFYTDDELEKITAQVGDRIKNEYNFANYDNIQDNILLYDGFGLDTRGVVLMYLNALGKNGYNVTYVTDLKVKDDIPSIKNICKKYGINILYVDMSTYEGWCVQLAKIFENIRPRAAFFYTTPFDTSACAAFHMYDGLCKRFLIDLTDHAYWLGKCANDYFLGSREMSAYIQHYERKIPKEKCIKLGVNLLLEECSDHSGLPFDVKKNTYIFSGGSLYKTLGDKDNTYYRIVRHILRKHNEIKFIYAGTGDDSELKKIIEEFPNRAFHINERKDFYYLIENSVLYLNTYPMFGGMMMKYSALAHRLPITLKHGFDSDGLLLHQKECQIEYCSYEDLIMDVDHLIDDNNYRQEREKLLDGSVVTEERFINNVYNVIENNKTDYAHEFLKLDTLDFRKEYYTRFNYNKNIICMVKRLNLSLFWYFPVVFITGSIRKIYNKVIKKGRNKNG